MRIDPAFWTGRRVLITGHTGFKGAWLALWLEALGARVSGLAPDVATTPSLYEAARVARELSAHRADVRDPQAVRGVLEDERPEIVFHLAGQPMVRRALREPRVTYEINVMGTVNVLDAVRVCDDVRAVVVVTSDKCYENPHGGPRRAFVEDDPLGGSDPYSSSKGCAELVTAAFRRSFFAGGEGARVGSARAGNVIGGGDWGEDRLIPDMLRAVDAGRPIRLRNPDAVRPWQHVLNPLSGYLLLAQALWSEPEVDEAWNFGPRDVDARPVRWIAERLTEMWSGTLKWELDQGENPPEAQFLALDSSKAERRLAWRPMWDLEQALTRVVQWHEEHRRGADMRQVSLMQLQEFGG